MTTTKLEEELLNMSLRDMVDFLESYGGKECPDICDVSPYTLCPICTASGALNDAYDVLREAIRNIKGNKCAGQNS